MKNPQICLVKRLILTVMLLALSWRGQAATHVVFDMEAFNASPATNRTVTMQRLQPFRGNLISYSTGTNSSVTASNLGIGDYDCVILQRGSASAIPFQITVTATNLGVIGANTNTSVRGQQSYPVSGASSWTILASEGRFGGGAIPNGSISTNKVDSTFWDYMLSLGGGTPDALTNNDTRTITLPGILRANNIRSTNSLYVDDAKLTSVSGRLLAEQGYQGRGTYLTDPFDVYIFPTNAPSVGQFLGIADDLSHTFWGSVSNSSGLDPRLTSSSGTVTVNSNTLAVTTLSATTVNAGSLSGNGSSLTSLNASQLSSGTVPEARVPHSVTNVINYVDNQNLFISKALGNNILTFESGSFNGVDEGLTTDYGITSSIGFEGNAQYLTNGTPDLATNNGTATDGMVLSKQGNRLSFISVAGGGDLVGANSLADIAGTGGSLGQARTNLSTHNADNLTRGTVALARLPSIPASQTTNSAKFSDWNMWTDGATYYAQNKLLTSTLSSNNFSGLLQTVASSAVTAGFSTRITVASGTDASASVSNKYYWFTNTVILTNGIVLQGAGNAATIFAASPALTGPLIQVGADGNFLGGIARFENIRWHGDAGAASSVGLKFRNVAEPNVSHCEFNGFQLAGIEIANTNYNHWSQILDTWFVGGAAGSHCILIDASPAAVTCDLDISRCKIEPHGGAGITVSNHFRNIRITDSRFGDSSGNSTAPIQIFAGNGFTIANNMFYPYWLSAVPLIRFGDRASATNINALVANNVANGFTPNNMVWIGTNVQGVSLIGNINPGGNVVTNGSGGNATYVRADREKIYTDGDITAGGTVSAPQASFTTQSNTTLNVASFVIANPFDIGKGTNLPITALFGSGGTNTAATNGTAGLVLASAGNGGVYWATDATGGGGTGSSNLTDVGTSVYVKSSMLFTGATGGLSLGRTNAVASSNIVEIYSGSTLQSRFITNGVFAGPAQLTTLKLDYPQSSSTAAALVGMASAGSGANSNVVVSTTFGWTDAGGLFGNGASLTNLLNLVSTNVVGQTGVLAPTSAATNYTVALLPGAGNDPLLIYSANTNLFITFTGTNSAFVNRSIIIDSLSNTVSGYIHFASPVKTNFNFVFAYTNGQTKVVNFFNPDTRGTNVLVSDGGYYRGNFQ